MSQVPDLDDLQWDVRARELKHTELERLRGTAEKWRNGLGSVTAVVGLATAAGAPFIGSELDSDVKCYLGIAIGIALFGLAGGSLCAMKAAFGNPSRIPDTGTALRDYTTAQTDSTVRYLAGAQWLTILGVASLAVAAAIAFWGSEQVEKYQTVRTDDGATWCGTLMFKDQILNVTGPDGSLRPLPVEDVASIGNPGSC